MFATLKAAATVARSLATREGREFLRGVSGQKALSHTVLQELIAGSGWFQGLPLSKLGDFDSYLRAAVKKVWVLWKCADIKAATVMDTPWKLVRQNKAGQEVDVTDINIERMLNHPNDWQTWEDLIYETVMHLAVTGNAFWAKDRTNFAGTNPSEIRPLNPKRMSIIIDVRNGLQGYVYRPVYAQDRADFSMPIPFEPREIIHFRVPNPDNDFWGLGDVEPAEMLFNDFINYDTWKQAYWARGATPTTLLILKSQFPGGQGEFQKFKSQYEKEYGGTENAGKVAWLSGDWSKQTMGLSLQEMQAIEERRWTCEQIAHQCGVPLSVIGLRDAANYATARVDDVRFRRLTIKPIIRRIEAKLNAELVGREDEGLKLKFNLSGLNNIEEITSNYLPLLQHGVVTPNEVRELVEMGKAEDINLDRHYMSAGLTPVELNGIADLGQVDAAAQGIRDSAIERMASPKDAVASSVEGSIQGTALNGAQVSSLVSLAQQVALGTLPMSSARAIAEASFPLVPAKIMDAVFKPLDKFTPAIAPEPVGGKGLNARRS